MTQSTFHQDTRLRLFFYESETHGPEILLYGPMECVKAVVRLREALLSLAQADATSVLIHELPYVWCRSDLQIKAVALPASRIDTATVRSASSRLQHCLKLCLQPWRFVAALSLHSNTRTGLLRVDANRDQYVWACRPEVWEDMACFLQALAETSTPGHCYLT